MTQIATERINIHSAVSAAPQMNESFAGREKEYERREVEREHLVRLGSVGEALVEVVDLVSQSGPPYLKPLPWI